jgi:hypothetical protein
MILKFKVLSSNYDSIFYLENLITPRVGGFKILNSQFLISLIFF